MLIWINGPYGGGKTQTAQQLHRRLPGSVVCNPEEVGYGLHRMTPAHLRGDFRDWESWRHGVTEVLDVVLRRHPDVVVAPMTLTAPEHVEQILGRLRAEGHVVRHVTLMAERETVVTRLRRRSLVHVLGTTAGNALVQRTEAFALSRLDACLDQLGGPLLAQPIWTDDRTLSQVAEAVATCAGVALRADDEGPLRARVRRAQTWRATSDGDDRLLRRPGALTRRSPAGAGSRPGVRTTDHPCPSHGRSSGFAPWPALDRVSHARDY